MPRVARFGGANRKGGNKPSTQAPPPLIDSPPSSQALPQSIDASSSSLASSALIDATPSTEAPLQAPPATQTRGRRRQYTEAPSQSPSLSTDALPSTQAPSSSQVSPPSTNVPPSTQASPSTKTPSQAPLVTTQPQSRQSIRYWTVDVRGNLSAYHVFFF